jgi:hypothetical protein
VAHHWQNIVNVTDTMKTRYMMYTNAFDCITQKQVRFANCEYFTQSWGFVDAKSLPTVTHRWQNIVNVTDTMKTRYMMYTNAFDCITQKQVRFEIVLLSPLIFFDCITQKLVSNF